MTREQWLTKAVAILSRKITREPELCGGCGHPILKGRPDCPECDRIAAEDPDVFTPCARNDPLPVEAGEEE